MKNKLFNTVLVLGVLLASVMTSIAYAGLIVNDLSDTFVTDTSTGFDWLDMSYTDGKSFNDVSALILADTLNGGGWEVASKAEVLDLLLHQNNNVSFSDDYTETVAKNSPAFFNFVELKGWLGPTFTSVVNGVTHSMIRGYTSDNNAAHVGNVGDQVTIQLGGSSNQVALGRGYLAVDYVGRSEGESNGAWGTFLVRKTTGEDEATKVPEPTTLAMFSLGFLGLTLRKKRA